MKKGACGFYDGTNKEDIKKLIIDIFLSSSSNAEK
jgi:hypothetical protein